MSESSLHMHPIYSLNPCVLTPECTLDNMAVILSRPSCAFAFLNMVFQALQNICASTFVSVLEGLLGRIIPQNHLAASSFSSLLLDIHVSRH
jgi:hypothetical protein